MMLPCQFEVFTSFPYQRTPFLKPDEFKLVLPRALSPVPPRLVADALSTMANIQRRNRNVVFNFLPSRVLQKSIFVFVAS
jgi:hypothetical protein